MADEIIETPTALTERDKLRVWRVFQSMHYASGLNSDRFSRSARKTVTMDDVVELLGELQVRLKDAAQSSQRRDEELRALRDTLRGGRRMLRLLLAEEG